MKSNKLFDINKLPTTEGIILSGISMNRIGNAQSAKKCFEYLNYLTSKIQYTDGIGMVMWYGDYLYFNSAEPAYTLRNRYKELMIAHKNAFLKLLKKDRKWTHKAFSFHTFGQLLLDNSDSYQKAYDAIDDLYKKDKTFQQYVNQDCASTGHNVGSREINFILEEITFFYLSQKSPSIKLGNAFVTDSDKSWVLQVYPGKPLQSEIYLFQKNPLQLSNPKNIYENSYYDLEEKKLYDYKNIDLKQYGKTTQ